MDTFTDETGFDRIHEECNTLFFINAEERLDYEWQMSVDIIEKEKNRIELILNSFY